MQTFKRGFTPLETPNTKGNHKKSKSLTGFTPLDSKRLTGFTPPTFVKKAGGFTLLEILIVISILLIITSIVVGPFSSFRNRSILNAEVENITTLLNEARSKTLTSLADSEYGVHFETSRMVFFKGNLFTEPDADNQEIIFNPTVSISDISLTGAGADVIFNRLTGKTDESGTITIGLTSDPTNNNIVYIYPTGSIEIK